MESRFLDKNVGLLLQIAVWILALYVAWYVVPRGYEKLIDIPGTMTFFATLGIPGYMAYLSGIVEFVGPLLMFVPRVAFYGALPVAINMFVASYSTGLGWGNIPFDSTSPLQLGIFALIIAIVTRPGFLFRKKPVITRITA